MFKKGFLSILLAFSMIFLASSSVLALEIKNPSFDISSKSAILMKNHVKEEKNAGISQEGLAKCAKMVYCIG